MPGSVGLQVLTVGAQQQLLQNLATAAAKPACSGAARGSTWTAAARHRPATLCRQPSTVMVALEQGTQVLLASSVTRTSSRLTSSANASCGGGKGGVHSGGRGAAVSLLRPTFCYWLAQQLEGHIITVVCCRQAVGLPLLISTCSISGTAISGVSGCQLSAVPIGQKPSSAREGTAPAPRAQAASSMQTCSRMVQLRQGSTR